MRAVRIPEFADPPGPVVVDIPTPEPGAGETLIELIAAEIAPLDRQIAMGNLPGAGPLPIQPGATGVGRVLSSETLDAGGLVYVGGGPFGIGNRRPGVMAEQVSVPDAAAVPIPEGVDPMLAAAGVSGGISARQSLFDYGRLQPDGTVLVLGATGSVGRAACQIAAAFGASVLAAGRDTSALDDLDAIPISIENLTAEVMAATGGKGADVIIDPLGGPLPQLRHPVRRAQGAAPVDRVQRRKEYQLHHPTDDDPPAPPHGFPRLPGPSRPLPGGHRRGA